jgi:small subunit ribosomal protein S17
MAETNSNPAATPETAAPGAAAAAEAARAKRKERVGEVISNKMTKTIVVRVERRYPHPKFKKVVTGYKKLYAHDEKSEAKVGDRVRIEETRPLSKIKRWRLVEVVTKSSGIAPVAA